MCVSPSYVFVARGDHHERVETPCGWCWSCNKNRINDLVGRCLLEHSECTWARAVTLTYSDKLCDPEQTSVIHKEDAQNFLHRLRRSHKVRYLVAGEYGKKKGRVHFHICLFGHSPKPPLWDLNKNIHVKEWPWGHVYVEDAVSERSIRYIAKYLLKGAKRKKTRHDNRYNKEWVSYSRIPIMGETFIRELAQRYARERVFPWSFKYRPPFAQKNREYQLTGEGRFVFLDELFEKWPEAIRAPKPKPMQRVCVAYIKDRARKRWDALPNEEREKILDREIISPTQVDHRWCRLLCHYTAERMEVLQIGTFEELKAQDRHLYNLNCQAFRRNISVQPPTHAEGGNYLAASARRGGR